LSPRIWTLVTDDLRLKIGARFGYYRANGDIPLKDRVQEFLNSVGGNEYKDEDSLGVELIEKLQHLRSAHYGDYNFYNEYPHAQAIEQSLLRAGIPRSARRDFVKVITICYIGNGRGFRKGVDENALPFYERFITRFEEADIVTFVTLFADHEFTKDLKRPKCQERTVALCHLLREKTKNVLIHKALDILIATPTLEKVHNTSNYKRVVQEIA
jgi:hypothetical protein